MFLKNKKAQISIEFLIILGVIILVVVVFVTFYLNLLNKNIDKTSQTASAAEVNRFIESSHNLPNITSPNNALQTCGNGRIDPLEVCDTSGGGVFPPEFTCANIPGITSGTTLKCEDCLTITCN